MNPWRCAAAGLTAVMFAAGAGKAVAALPPGPPPPPDCKACSGPPPPPTLLPTPAPTLVPSQQVVEVHLAPARVARGHRAKLHVVAPNYSAVDVQVRYHGARTSRIFHTTVGMSGALDRSWQVPRTAPLGTAQVKVEIGGTDGPFTMSLIVTR